MKSIEQKHAPEIQQEPIAWQCDVLQSDATFKTEFSSIEPPVNMYSVRNVIPLYRSHPDAQAEIAKRDEHIAELEKKAELPMKYKRMQFNAELQKEVEDQAAEISRLKEVIAKVLPALTKTLSALIDENPLCWQEIIQEAKEALAAIKEEGL